jgi:hypothetical protein
MPLLWRRPVSLRRLALPILLIISICPSTSSQEKTSRVKPHDDRALQEHLAIPRKTALSAVIAANGEADVRAIYLVPSDVSPRAAFPSAVSDAIRNLQSWYAVQMTGMTFALPASIVETIVMDHPATWYANNKNGEDRVAWFWNNVTSDGFSKTGGSFDDPLHIWVFYVDATPDKDQIQGGTNGVAVLSRNDVTGILGLSSEPVCRWIGGLGHELGHAFGLDHPSACESGKLDPNAAECQSLMFLGYQNYCGTLLTLDDKNRLLKSSFFSSKNLPQTLRLCAN